MLTELRIRNFALIDQLSVELGPGLNVLTGETGAGKSIVVGALSLLLGERASAAFVREGEERAAIEGVFELEDGTGLRPWLEERGIDVDDGLLILKREVSQEGRSRAWINGSPTTAALLGDLGGRLVNLHGQHEHQTLLRRDEQRAVLDAFAGNAGALDEVARAHAALATAAEELRTLEQRRREIAQRADFLRYQVEEIGAAKVELGEEEKLEEEFRRLSHAEELLELASSIIGAVASGGASASDRLDSARRTLDQLVRIDPSQEALSELFDTAYYALEELGNRLEKYLLLVEHDPERLEQVRRRQDLLYRLRSKYGPTLADVLATLESATAELALVEDADWKREELSRQVEAARAGLRERSAALSERRAAAADRMATEVNRILPELGMEGGTFAVAALPLPEPGACGGEEIEFRVSLNRGFEPRPLAQVASGGELSRVMLALKTILTRLDEVPTVIFDEVDAGIGGRVALQVGDKMRQVAGAHQVLAITHLPQIASRGHRHLLVQKSDGAGKTTTSVTLLSSEERVAEIARMLGGDPESQASLAHARELLDRAIQ